MASGTGGDDDENIFIRPQCLISTNENGQFLVDASALDQLKELDGDVIVVAIVGPYRTGKSYLMNRLCGHYTGFPLGSTVQSKTKGIWVWVRVHPQKPDKYLVLLDTEGLGDVEKGDCKHDDAISCLATLLSSTLIYNILGRIDADTLNKLHFVSELSKHIYSRAKPFQNRTDDNEEEEDDSEKQTEEEEDTEVEETEEDVDTKNSATSNVIFNFPDFVFILRDFDLELKMDGKDVTANEYLERNLSLKPGSTREIKNCNRVRCSLRQAFTRRNCFTLIRPVAGKTKCLETMSDGDLEPEFIDNTATFIHHILDNSCVKVIDGRRVNGKILASLISLYVDQMNNGVLPNVTDAVSIMRKKENEDAVAAALALYDDQILSQICRQPFPISQEDFAEIHSNCLHEALKLFQSRAIFLDEDLSFQRTLTEEVFVKYKDYSEQNEVERQTLCQEVLQQLYDEMVRVNVQDGVYAVRGGYQVYEEDMRRLENLYTAVLGSNALESVLFRFREEHYAEKMVLAQADDEVVQADEKAREEQLRAMAAQRQREEANQRRLQQEQLMRQRELLHQDVISNLSRVAADQQEQVRRRHNEVLEHQLHEQKRLLQEGFAREAASLDAQIQALQRQ